jgi:hypothetical protein
VALKQERRRRKTGHALEASNLIGRPLAELNRCDLPSESQELLQHVCCGQHLKKGQDKEDRIVVRGLQQKQGLKVAKAGHIIGHTRRHVPRSTQDLAIPNAEAFLIILVRLLEDIRIDLLAAELADTEAIDTSRPGLIIPLAIGRKVSA